MSRRTITLIALCSLVIGAVLLTRPLPATARADRILVEKAARKLTLFQGDRILKTYRISLGGQPVGPKEFEGDQKTPEGSYFIAGRNPQSSYHLSLRISYPDIADIARAEALGRPPGGEIMIHGQPNGSGWLSSFAPRRDWTAGCIAVNDREIEEIWRAVPDGAPIEIRP